MDSARRLALRLHALHEADRAWLLQQIEAEPRQQLTSLLDEISALGLLPDPSVLAFASEGRGIGSEEQAETAMRIGMTSAATACQLLRNEPVFVRRYLSHVQQWPWIAELDQEQAIFLQRAADDKSQMAQLRLAPCAHRALLRAFATQLAETNPSSMPVSQRVRRSLFGRFRRAG